jgi:hypothetical protein
MNELVEKILTDKNARSAEEATTIAVAQNKFETWE